jgi:hypothetical protein
MNHQNKKDEQIRTAVEMLVGDLSDRWRAQLGALRATVNQQISSMEKALDESKYKPDLLATVQHISGLAADGAGGKGQQTGSVAGQSLAAIEAALHARLDSEMTTNAMLREALAEAKQQLASVINQNRQLAVALNELRAGTRGDSRPKVAALPKKPLQFSEPARDTKRVKIRRGILVNVDGIAGELVDLSLGGAQTLLTQGVKPNQLVRLVLPTTDGQIICKGRIVWAVYEQPATSVSVYRSGVKFTDVDTFAIERFMADFCEMPTLGQSPRSKQNAV